MAAARPPGAALSASAASGEAALPAELPEGARLLRSEEDRAHIEQDVRLPPGLDHEATVRLMRRVYLHVLQRRLAVQRQVLLRFFAEDDGAQPPAPVAELRKEPDDLEPTLFVRFRLEGQERPTVIVYQAVRRSSIEPDTAGGAALDAAPGGREIDEIALVRGGCGGTCPETRLVLRRSGAARYIGRGTAARLGFYRGAIEPQSFARLAALLIERRFFDLRDRYDGPTPDRPLLTLSVRRGRVSKAVQIDTGLRWYEQPLDAWLLLLAIEEVSRTIDWRRDAAAESRALNEAAR